MTADPSTPGGTVLAVLMKHGVSVALAGVLLYVMLVEQRQQLREVNARSAEMLAIVHALAGRCLPTPLLDPLAPKGR